MRRALLAAATVAGALAAAAPARAESVFVLAQTQSFAPKQLDVLPGDRVIWRNVSTKTHNVKFETEGFNSGRIAPRGVANHEFTTGGVFPYICTIHDGMVGEIGVYPVVLEGPTRRVRRGTSIAFGVRAPEGAGDVRIEADYGSGFAPVAVAGPVVPDEGHEGHDGAGMMHADVPASETATYRAAFSGGTSNELRVEVTDAPDVLASTRRRQNGTLVKVSTRPVTPGTRVVLQVKLRERFGWWPVDRARLDRRGRARFSVRGYAGAPARVVVVGPDWATLLNDSRTIRLPR